MSHKYEAWFCTCGRIHFHPMADLDWMADQSLIELLTKLRNDELA